MKRTVFVILLCIFILFSTSADSIPVLKINNYKEPTLFHQKKVVLIKNNDNSHYKEIDFDDSLWDVISLPSDWDSLYKNYNGICWYRIHILFPETLPENSLGISLGTITDADETYFNGKLIGSSGRIPPDQKSAYDKIRIYELPTTYIKPGEDNVLAIRIKGLFSYQNGPYTGDFRIDTYSKLQQGYFFRELFDMLFIVTYVIVGIYFLLFFLRRIRDKENLLFALFSLGMAVYFFLRTQLKYFIGIDFFILKKIEYLVLCWLVLCAIEFIVFYFKKKHTIFNYILWGSTLISFGVILFTGDYVFWDTFNQYFMVPSWAVGVAIGMWIVVKKLKTDIDARLMIVPFLILLATFINDILVNMAVIASTRLANYGFLFLIVSIAIILSNRFVRLHYEVEDLNLNLEKKVEDRTKELHNTVRALEDAKAETDNILKNVKEGIFLINTDFIIGHNYSKTLEQILETEVIAEQNFITLISTMIDEKTVASIKDFLTIIFTRNLPDKRLQKLNPLEESKFTFRTKETLKDIKYTFRTEETFIEKYLNFAFSRITDKDETKYILATVRDITERKKLVQQIEVSKEKSQAEMKLLFGILHVNPKLLKRFIREVHDDLKQVEELLEKTGFSGDLKSLLNSIFRYIHSIKGNAGILGLEMFARQAHEFEEKIKTLYEKQKLAPVDLVNLLYPIVDLKKQVTDIEKALAMITSFETSYGKTEMNDQNLLKEALINLTKRITSRLHKNARIITDSFTLPKEVAIDYVILKNILIQLVKNAITHGIEAPEIRKAEGKPETGTIEIASMLKDNTFIITVRDDGKGIQLSSLRQILLESGKYSREELNKISMQNLVHHIFEPGITTQKQTSIEAGRGIGLDIVKHELEKNHGKIKLSFKQGEYTMFTLILPLKT